MASVLLIRAHADRGLAQHLSQDLHKRGFVVDEQEPSVATEPLGVGERDRRILLTLLPQAEPTALSYGRFLDYLSRAREQRSAPIVIARADDELPPQIVEPQAVIRCGGPGLTYDHVFEAVFRAILPTLPPYLDLVVRPSVMEAPTGVTWWSDDLFVADEHYGHLARIDGPNSSISHAGLDEPHQLHLDRRKLLFTNKSVDEVLLADAMQAGALANVRPLAGLRGFCRPTSVHQSHGVTVVADTDNHRVLITQQDVWRDPPDWTAVAPKTSLRYPCGVLATRGGVWAADTHNRRICLFSNAGECLATLPGQGDDYDFSYPVGLAIDAREEILVVADEGLKRIMFFRLSADGGAPLELVLAADSATVPSGGSLGLVGTPSGMSINRENRLAIVDRGRRCIWLMELDEVPELHADPPTL